MTLQDNLGIDERINEAFQPISNFWEGLILHEFFGTGIPTIIPTVIPTNIEDMILAIYFYITTRCRIYNIEKQKFIYI